jgi:UDP:flavonoid glycosyltransferase YjiC (YdhE family)
MPLPTNARAASFLPFDLLLPKVDLLVTNGGYGSVSQALAAGVPIVSAGRTEDKAEVGARISWSGVGVDLATDTPTVEAVRAAALRVLDEPGFRVRAGEIAAAFARLDAGREILAALDALAEGGDVGPAPEKLAPVQRKPA